MKEHAAPAGPRYQDPLSDAGFLQIFGNAANKRIVIDFLNVLLLEAGGICDLQYLPVTSPSVDGEQLLDLLCTNKKGEHLLVHLQRSDQLTPDASLVYHGVRLLMKQPGEVDDDYFKRIYCVGLMNFNFLSCKSAECILDTRFTLKLGTRGAGPLYDVSLLIKMIEVPLFRKSENELSTDLDKWLFLLKNMGGLKEIPASLKSPAFEAVFQAATL